MKFNYFGNSIYLKKFTIKECETLEEFWSRLEIIITLEVLDF